MKDSYIGKAVFIGQDTIIHPMCSIGTAPFFYRDKVIDYKMVEIGKNVVIHSGTNVNYGVSGKTIIGDNVKIDSNCHIAHDCKIGQGTIIAAGFVCGGYVTIGENCRIALNVTVKNRIEIADNTFIGMGAVITHNVSGRVIPIRKNIGRRLMERLSKLMPARPLPMCHCPSPCSVHPRKWRER